MLTPRLRTRRTFLADLGRGSFALAVVWVTGCAPAGAGSAAPSTASASAGAGTSPEGIGSGSASPAGALDGIDWERVDLGFVSAYILVRDGEAAVVDTGVTGSAEAIGASLTGIGLDWDAVGHVILTHMHSDHAGSAEAVLDLAPTAAGYAGAEDIPGIAVPRPLTPVADGDHVFDLRIVTTPGHTAGHIAVLDEIGGVLVAGDALRTEGGGVSLPDAGFTDDMDEAKRSVAKLGTLRFETLLVGHGEPVLSGASAEVAALAGS
jgi:glyoxylase-like metal-dependent hydrolase (beta-lactamase superfamily II)